MSRDYTPRRCSKRWLDGDCPDEVLAIIHHNEAHGAGYDVIYGEVNRVQYGPRGRQEKWMQGFSITEHGASADHFELQAYEVASFRYRFKHRYARWSDLPDAVKNAIRRDIAEAKAYVAQYEGSEK